MATLSIGSFTIKNFHRSGTTARLKIWFDQDFVTEGDEQLVLGGPVRSGSIYVDLPLDLNAVTKELTIPELELPITNNSSARNARATALLFDAAGAFVRNLFTGWIIPEQLSPSCDYSALNAYNANPANRPPPAGQLSRDALITIINSMIAAQAVATDSTGGVVFLSFPPDINTDPVVWAVNDPLVRDALKLRTIPIQDFEADPPADLEFLGFNGTTGRFEALNPGFGTGNVLSSETVSVDRQLVAMAGTSGKAIQKLTETGAVSLVAGVVQVETLVVRQVPTGAIDGVNDTFVLAETPIAGSESVYVAGVLQNANVTFTLDYVLTNDTIVFQAGHLPQTGQSVLVSYRTLV